MAQSFISEIGDRLGYDGVANTNGEHVKTISAEYYKRIDNGVVSNVRIQDAISSTGNGKVVATDQSSVNSEFKLLATASASPTSGALTEAVYDTGITMNPSTNTLTANLSGTVNGYTIGKSVPSDAKFTDTTYTANNGVSLSGTTFSNSGVRSATINGIYLRVNTGGTNADLTIPYATSADKLTMPSSGSNAITGVESSGGYLTQAYSNTGYPETYGNVLTVGGKGGSQLFMGWSGSTQGISKVYYRNRRDVATTSGECWSDWKAFAWSDHKHSGSDITSGTVGVSYGGTGKSSVTANNFLVGNGTSALVEKTPTEVRSLIGAGTSSLTIGTSSTTAAAGNHSHGNITSDGKLQSSDVSIAAGDKIVVTDSSNSNKVARTSLSFDGSTTSQALTKKGTFETFAKITWLDGIPLNPVPGMIYAI